MIGLPSPARIPPRTPVIPYTARVRERLCRAVRDIGQDFDRSSGTPCASGWRDPGDVRDSGG